MPQQYFSGVLDRLHNAANAVLEREIDLTADIDQKKAFHDFKESQVAYYKNTIAASIDELSRFNVSLVLEGNSAESVNQHIKNISEQRLSAKSIIEEIEKIREYLQKKGTKPSLSFSIPRLPAEIKSDVTADIGEIKKCYETGCYRSAVVMCGRILETALHRKYFEETGQDILEKSPGIGLGNLVAKLKEKNVELDPAITQQIHLINQARIFSVHKKQEAFQPTKDQSQAIILYTMDIVRKLF